MTPLAQSENSTRNLPQFCYFSRSHLAKIWAGGTETVDLSRMKRLSAAVELQHHAGPGTQCDAGQNFESGAVACGK